MVPKLVSKGRWEPLEVGYQFAGDSETDLGQSTEAYVTNLREKARARQVRKRSSSPVTRDVPRDVGKEGLGKDRKERQGGDDWPRARQPGGGAQVSEDEVL